MLRESETASMPATVTKFLKRISGSMLDRKVSHLRGEIDIHIEVPRVDYQILSNDHLGEISASIREWRRAMPFGLYILIERRSTT